MDPPVAILDRIVASALSCRWRRNPLSFSLLDIIMITIIIEIPFEAQETTHHRPQPNSGSGLVIENYPMVFVVLAVGALDTTLLLSPEVKRKQVSMAC